jgi:hypothetical protein
MSRWTRVAIGLFAGIAIGASFGYAAVLAFSSNAHDRALEAVMTAAFATGPLGGALGVAVALWMGRRA